MRLQLVLLGSDDYTPLLQVRPWFCTYAATEAQRGVVMVSGLAHGIDSAAPRRALGARVKRVAVLGCGVDVTYPPREQALKRSNRGAVILELPIGTSPSGELSHPQP